ncbi:hypothetical protein CH1034_180035 [Klebsiella pneumoniae]|nr:hypothetical protein CH1034_180035 [Klebsiella pneumoniae]
MRGFLSRYTAFPLPVMVHCARRLIGAKLPIAPQFSLCFIILTQQRCISEVDHRLAGRDI